MLLKQEKLNENKQLYRLLKIKKTTSYASCFQKELILLHSKGIHYGATFTVKTATPECVKQLINRVK